MMEALPSSETSVLKRATQCNIRGVGILHSDHCENLKSYISLIAYVNCEKTGTYSCYFNSMQYAFGVCVGSLLWWHWPSNLCHELSLSTQTLRSLVQIQLQAWMVVCIYSVSVSSCM
jgi:hypothetical protein